MVAFVPVFALAPLDFSSDVHSLQSHYSFAPVFALALFDFGPDVHSLQSHYSSYTCVWPVKEAV